MPVWLRVVPDHRIDTLQRRTLRHYETLWTLSARSLRCRLKITRTPTAVNTIHKMNAHRMNTLGSR